MFRALKPGGLFLFMDRYHFNDLVPSPNRNLRRRNLNAFSRIHPLTFTRSFFENHMRSSYDILLHANEETQQLLFMAGKKTAGGTSGALLARL